MAESILDLTDGQLVSAQAKITYLGDQDKVIGTVVWCARGRRVSMARFLAVQPSGAPYSNDESPYTSQFDVKLDEFRQMLGAVKASLTKPAAALEAEFLSFDLVRDTGAAVEGHEFRIGRAGGEEFYRSLMSALSPENEPGRTALSKQLRSVYPR